MKNKFNKIFTTFIFIISIFAFSSCNIDWLDDWMEDNYHKISIKTWHIQVYFEEELNPGCYMTIEESNRITKNIYPEDFDKKWIVADVAEEEKLHTCFEPEEMFYSWYENVTFKISLHTENGNTYEGEVFIEEAIQCGAYQKCELTNINNKDDKILCYFVYLFFESI